MKKSLTVLIIMLAGVGLLAGCATKGTVEQEVSDAEARLNARYDQLNSEVSQNAQQLDNLMKAQEELQGRVDKAINEMAGFENYTVIWSGEVNFEFDQFAITTAAEQILMEAGEAMERNPKAIAEFEGHTDRTGDSKYNIWLGEERAQAAKRFLNERFGISLFRLFTVSHGEDKPVAMADENQAASKNRRVSIQIWGPPQTNQ